MAYDKANKKLYVDTANGKGISLHEIAACLQYYKRDAKGHVALGMMVENADINIWSKNKPFVTSGDKYKVQTENDRYLSAYGFYWWNYGNTEANAPFATSASALFNLAVTRGGAWLYNRPVGEARVRDFDGYNGLAVNPYYYQIGQPSEGKNLYVKPVVDPFDENAEIKITNMPSLVDSNADLADLKLVILYRKKNASNINGVFATHDDGTPVTIADIENGLGGSWSQQVTLPVSASDTGELQGEIVFAATNADSIDDSGTEYVWMYFPESYRSIVYKALAGIVFKYDDASISSGFRLSGTIGTIWDDTQELTSLDMNLEGENDLGYAVEYRIEVVMWDNQSETISDPSFRYEDTGEWAADENIGFEFSFDMVDVNGSKIPSEVSIAMNVLTRKSGTTEAYSTSHFDFLLGGNVQYAASDGQTLYDIMMQRISEGKYTE